MSIFVFLSELAHGTFARCRVESVGLCNFMYQFTSNLAVAGECNFHDLGFDWDFCCGRGGVQNLWFWGHGSGENLCFLGPCRLGFVYYSWL